MCSVAPLSRIHSTVFFPFAMIEYNAQFAICIAVFALLGFLFLASSQFLDIWPHSPQLKHFVSLLSASSSCFLVHFFTGFPASLCLIILGVECPFFLGYIFTFSS
ncbi:hypothetical protein AVEN_214858-1 [Araneus ventricosus]|uniref:Uncharacterized protein n=1 Tax=Araneus ventricosus TaxID=182803 RepID=A0A4Y2HJU3_ARAVE|nr:hypothetical protein AVEN_214858-1 [Araneus ventricosus]